jgi:hypothetical protein
MSWELHELVVEHGVALGEKRKVDRLVHLELALLAGEDRIAHPGYERLMKVTQSSRATVARTLRRLCDIGAIEQVQRGGGVGVAAEYRVVVPASESVSPERDPLHQGERVSPTCDPSPSESVSPERDPSASQEGLKRVSPTRARVDAHELTKPPKAPQGGRRRDRSRYEQQAGEWAAAVAPGYHPNAVIGYVNDALRRGLTDEGAIRAHLDRMTGAQHDAHTLDTATAAA